MPAWGLPFGAAWDAHEADAVLINNVALSMAGRPVGEIKVCSSCINGAGRWPNKRAVTWVMDGIGIVALQSSMDDNEKTQGPADAIVSTCSNFEGKQACRQAASSEYVHYK